MSIRIISYGLYCTLTHRTCQCDAPIYLIAWDSIAIAYMCPRCD